MTWDCAGGEVMASRANLELQSEEQTNGAELGMLSDAFGALLKSTRKRDWNQFLVLSMRFTST